MLKSLTLAHEQALAKMHQVRASTGRKVLQQLAGHILNDDGSAKNIEAPDVVEITKLLAHTGHMRALADGTEPDDDELKTWLCTALDVLLKALPGLVSHWQEVEAAAAALGAAREALGRPAAELQDIKKLREHAGLCGIILKLDEFPSVGAFVDADKDDVTARRLLEMCRRCGALETSHGQVAGFLSNAHLCRVRRDGWEKLSAIVSVKQTMVDEGLLKQEAALLSVSGGMTDGSSWIVSVHLASR